MYMLAKVKDVAGDERRREKEGSQGAPKNNTLTPARGGSAKSANENYSITAPNLNKGSSVLDSWRGLHACSTKKCGIWPRDGEETGSPIPLSPSSPLPSNAPKPFGWAYTTWPTREIMLQHWTKGGTPVNTSPPVEEGAERAEGREEG